MKPLSFRVTGTLAVLGIVLFSLSPATAQTSAFTYQGRLADNGTPANGVYAMQFSVFDGPTNGVQISGTLTITNSVVTNGLLTATLDFGTGVFTGPDRWLQIGVRPDASTNAFAVLNPRQLITRTPYAIYSALAGGVPTGTISSSQMAPNAIGTINVQSNAITLSKIAAGQIVKSLNGLRDDVVLVPGSGLSLNTSGNVLQLSADVGSYWNVNGNSGTTSNQFLGTTDNTPLELRVNNTRALRLEPATSSPNIIGGFAGNFISSGVHGSSIGGGGNSANTNTIAANYAVIGGGLGNTIRAGTVYGTVSGGRNNVIETNANESVIAGGANSIIKAAAIDSAISGGWSNYIGSNSFSGVIGGGSFNTIEADAPAGSIAGGRNNTISANAYRSTIGGGVSNTNKSQQATIGGGANNLIQTNAVNAIIAGGSGNTAGANNVAIIGGNQNTASGDTSTIGGGYLNIASGSGSFIGGGNENQVTNFDDVVSGGFKNMATGGTAFVGAGYLNVASGFRGAIVGGEQNQAAGNWSFIGGGSGNTASGQYADIPGGCNNAATNDYSFAAGRRAKAKHQGAFVWGDSTDADVPSTTNNQFVVRASGGVVFYSDPAAASGVFLPPGGGGFSSLSDRNSKANISAVDGRAVLDRLVAIPIATWNYKSQNEAVHHMGAMAQDFAAAFGLGEDAKHISTVDADGVALAAIQGLNQKLQNELQRRDTENAVLKARLDAMEKLIEKLSTK